jgi:hypothetical protein
MGGTVDLETHPQLANPGPGFASAVALRGCP